MTNLTNEKSIFTQELNILGIKMTYSKAFGVVFLVIFILLFFPGIGISSSGLKGQGEKA